MTQKGIKVVILGQSGVGKTCIVNSAVLNSFSDVFAPTVGASFSIKNVTVNNEEVILHLWDTAGHERFESMTPLYFHGAQIALLVFSITDIDSFEKVSFWNEKLKEHDNGSIKLFVVANKSDLQEERVIPLQSAIEKSESFGAQYHEVSAKTRSGIDELFEAIALVTLNEVNKMQNISAPIPIPPELKAKKGCC